MPRVRPKPQFAIIRGLELAIEGLNALDKLCPKGYEPLQAEARMIRDAFATRRAAIEAMGNTSDTPVWCEHCVWVAQTPTRAAHFGLVLNGSLRHTDENTRWISDDDLFCSKCGRSRPREQATSARVRELRAVAPQVAPEVHEALAAIMMAVNEMHERNKQEHFAVAAGGYEATLVKDAITKVGKLKALTQP